MRGRGALRDGGPRETPEKFFVSQTALAARLRRAGRVTSTEAPNKAAAAAAAHEVPPSRHLCQADKRGVGAGLACPGCSRRSHRHSQS